MVKIRKKLEAEDKKAFGSSFDPFLSGVFLTSCGEGIANSLTAFPPAQVQP